MLAAVLATCGFGCAMSGRVVFSGNSLALNYLFGALTVGYALLASATAGAVARAYALAVWQKSHLCQGLCHALRIPHVEVKAEQELKKEPTARQMGSLLRKVSSCCLAAAALLQNARRGLQETLSDAAREARREQNEIWARASNAHDILCRHEDLGYAPEYTCKVPAGDWQIPEDTAGSDTTTLVEYDAEERDVYTPRRDTLAYPVLMGEWQHRADYWDVLKRAAIQRASVSPPTQKVTVNIDDMDSNEMLDPTAADVTSEAIAALRANKGFASPASHLSDVVEEEEDERRALAPSIAKEERNVPGRTLSRRGKNSNLRNLAHRNSLIRGQAVFKNSPILQLERP